MKRSIIWWITSGIWTASHLVGGPALASGADFTPLTKPQYKLYSVCSNKISASKEDLRLIAENFAFYHGKFPPDQADAIRKINPAFKCLTYINSTYTQSVLLM